VEYSESTIFVTGVAKPSKDDPISSIYDVFFLSLIVDKETEIIVDATCNTARDMTKDFVRCLLVGQSLTREIDSMVQAIQHRFFGLAQKALIVALKDAYNRYMIAKKTRSFECG
jgi:hypothetical protein